MMAQVDPEPERRTTIDRLIVNSPYAEPTRYWHYDPATKLFSLVEGRRPAGYIVATPGARERDDPGQFVGIPLVNQIRPRVAAWRAAGYPGVTSITKRLLEHWTDPVEFEARRFFFCQLEAIETLIWLAEGPAADRVGLDIPSDGGAFQRLCCKMATGSGKTHVMAMAIAWHILNKVTYPQDTRFSRNVLVLTPGLTVRQQNERRLTLSHPENYYQAWRIVPSELLSQLRQGRVLVRNWQALGWESADQVARKRGVDRRGTKSDAAYAREVLGDMARASSLLVINDEAHHAWRVNPEAVGKYLRQRDMRDSAQEATVWVGGLDRLHKVCGLLASYDYSATPFAPSGQRSTDEMLFGWIVSDFGLTDAIESGLVKTPRVVVRDDALPDAETYRSRLYHIYRDPEVQDDLNRRAQEHEPLPDLVTNAYYLLGYDWREALRKWQARGLPTPPVMITVCNRTETAARVRHAFEHEQIHIAELCDPARLLHIDSKVLAAAEAAGEAEGEQVAAVASMPGDEDAEEATEGQEVPERKLTKNEQAELLRLTVGTVGRVGQPGEQVHNVISVGMLNEGWDARTVTHIMGLRAFSSQLLCEQVVGRGLRRLSYEINPETGLFDAEYVNIFGVPFAFLPHETQPERGQDGDPPRVAIEPDPAKAAFEICWPNVVRIEHTYRPNLSLDWARVPPLELDASRTAQVAELAPILEGKPDVTRIDRIELERLAREFRMQRIVFEAARDVYDQMQGAWRGSRDVLLAQLVRLTEQFVRSDRLTIHPPLFYQDELRRRLIITLNMTRVVQHLADAVRVENTERLEPVFDEAKPIRCTGDMMTWWTGKPCERTLKSHINLCVYDSTWEASDAYALDHSPHVTAWAKNDHLGFEVLYIYRGVVRKYRPDFLARLTIGDMLVLETKGQDDEEQRTKRRYLDEWVRAVNEHGGFGHWRWAVALRPGEVLDVLEKAISGASATSRPL